MAEYQNQHCDGPDQQVFWLTYMQDPAVNGAEKGLLKKSVSVNTGETRVFNVVETRDVMSTIRSNG